MLKRLLISVTFVNSFLFLNVCALLHLDEASDRFPLDRRVHQDALDPELCQRQLTYLTNENLLLLARFLDAGIRVPRSILMGNTMDLGNFYQCLAINEEAEDMTVSGKYCRIEVPINQDLQLPDLPTRSSWRFNPSELHLDDVVLRQLEEIDLQKRANSGIFSPDTESFRIGPDSPLANLTFSLAICIPRPCSTEQAINGLLFNMSEIGFQYDDITCRLPDDKPWAAADYVAVVVFSIIGAVTLVSTSYDLYQTLYLKNDRKKISTLYSSFSVYTNTRRLLTFKSNPGSLECLDGIRAIAMIWVILGHSFFTIAANINAIEAFQWSISAEAMWVTVAPLTVDTFFFLSGLLLVYTTVGKIGRTQLLKKIHIFYLHRLLRMFPVLATVVLFEASLYLRVSDGPLWDRVALNAYKCREFWWSTLLHLQNIVNPREACIGVSWYLAIDIQLHILSPIVLFWVLSTRKAAWTALNTSLLVTLVASTAYIFYRNFPSGIISPNRQDDMTDFFIYYYVNILTRATPFLVGMLYGYLIHLWRNDKAYISKSLTTILLPFSLALLGVAMYCAHIAMTLEWDNQLADNLFNSFLRPLWALALGWMILACVQGRAEPINWILCLRMWKLPARISYAMYLIHFSIMVVFYSTQIAPVYFSVTAILFNFLGFLLATIIISFIVTLIIDSPFSTIFKLVLGSPKRQEVPKKTIEEHSLAKDSKSGINNDGFNPDEENKMSQDSIKKSEELKLNINEEVEKDGEHDKKL